ncbi:MAG TPA: hypothetical protein VK402_09465 [Blastococcus sp.]|nr:hypothetical protein [Blastococcus sp.]
MRKSRVLLAGVAVAAAGVATSAFTASNTMPADSVLGYGEVQVTGATVTSVAYNRDSGDSSILTDIVFTTSTTITTETGTLTLKMGSTPVEVATCVLAGTAGSQTFTCATTASLDSFDTVGLTVAS